MRCIAAFFIMLGCLLAGPAGAAIAIVPPTNERLYLDIIGVCRDAIDLRDRTTLLAERLYAIGIPNDPANGGEVPVTGFEDALNLTKADVAAGIGIVLGLRDHMDAGKLQVCATILRNQPAE